MHIVLQKPGRLPQLPVESCLLHRIERYPRLQLQVFEDVFGRVAFVAGDFDLTEHDARAFVSNRDDQRRRAVLGRFDRCGNDRVRVTLPLQKQLDQWLPRLPGRGDERGGLAEIPDGIAQRFGLATGLDPMQGSLTGSGRSRKHRDRLGGSIFLFDGGDQSVHVDRSRSAHLDLPLTKQLSLVDDDDQLPRIPVDVRDDDGIGIAERAIAERQLARNHFDQFVDRP